MEGAEDVHEAFGRNLRLGRVNREDLVVLDPGVVRFVVRAESVLVGPPFASVLIGRSFGFIWFVSSRLTAKLAPFVYQVLFEGIFISRRIKTKH